MIFSKFQITAGLHLWQIFRSYMNSKLIRQFFGQWNRHGALCNVVWCQMWYVHALWTMIQSNAGEIMKPTYFLCKRNIMEKPSKITIYLIKMLKLLRALSPHLLPRFCPWTLLGTSVPGPSHSRPPQLQSHGCARRQFGVEMSLRIHTNTVSFQPVRFRF